jgi:alginate O-acetyltransferase complex protein AlgI
MLFASFEYCVFLLVTLLAFLHVPARRRWTVLVAASAVFYAAFGAPHLLGILLLVALSSFWIALRIASSPSERARRSWFYLGVGFNILVLVGTKYLWLARGLHFNQGLLVSIGVSYYTVQAISYLVDVSLELAQPEHHFGKLLLYFAFFPKVAQGPIERAGVLLPQLDGSAPFDYAGARHGLFLIAGGLVKKALIADRLGSCVDPVFAGLHSHSGWSLIATAYLYSFQIYLDFSGYTDIARGSAALFNIRLTENFKSPYLALSIPDFWRRWHISFSQWLSDYVFKPLQISLRRWRIVGTWVALLVAFLVSGFWHGTGWTFIAWGLLHGLYMVASIQTTPVRRKLAARFPLPKLVRSVPRWAITFNLVTFSWIFFRADSLHDAWYFIAHLFSFHGDGIPTNGNALATAIGFGAILILLAIARRRVDLMHYFLARSVWLRWSLYYAIAFGILFFRYSGHRMFIYMKF